MHKAVIPAELNMKTLAPCFRPTAFADDGIIVACEWLEPEGKGYLGSADKVVLHTYNVNNQRYMLISLV